MSTPCQRLWLAFGNITSSNREGEEATTHWWGLSSLARFGVIARSDSRVVHSGKIWTAAGVSAGLDLVLTLVDEIAGREAAEVAQLIIEYDGEGIGLLEKGVGMHPA